MRIIAHLDFVKSILQQRMMFTESQDTVGQGDDVPGDARVAEDEQ